MNNSFLNIRTITEHVHFCIQTGSCRFLLAGFGGVEHGYRASAKGDEQALKRAVALLGPQSVAFYVEQNFFDYGEGENSLRIN